MNEGYIFTADGSRRIGYRKQWDESSAAIGFVFFHPFWWSDPVGSRECEAKARNLGGGGVDVLFLDPHFKSGDLCDEVRVKAIEQLEQCQPVIACWWGKDGSPRTAEQYLELVRDSGYRNTLQHFGVDKKGRPKRFNAIARTKPIPWRL
ncbi:DUF1643 domain-containing protein [Paenalcaligenes suwonensis]|uniref:DUF1643 domain-containing protein n=1 Tax=Paenalcaligenes suwonensis TaxID=1202713 RepID=UPI00140994D5|nr:DUF1643 domain-containing protein [Paenalcaligenes suwonensis]NHC62192.1 DUF1643 domain-containing protein [Paenalcaligenes suwonensis]